MLASRHCQNTLVGQKVAIVTHKAQTTRARLRAVVMHEQSQVVLVDTPGIFSGVKKLDKAMVQEAWSGAEEADAVLVVLDASRALPAETELVLAEGQEYIQTGHFSFEQG